LGKDPSRLKAVTCHLGNGSSICAVMNGKSVDTSMGFTPLAGVPMGTRSGDIDPAIVTFLMENEKMSTKEVNDYLNKKSGMLGLSKISSDFRDIEDAAKAGDSQANLALDIFAYRVKQYIAMYAAAMNGLDVLIFTAGVGENSDVVRERVTKDMDFLGISIDKEKNKVRGKEADISSNGAKVKTLVIPTNEELMIARETLRLAK
jgi:acetate kinase